MWENLIHLALVPFNSCHLAKLGWVTFNDLCAKPGDDVECEIYEGWVKSLGPFTPFMD